MCYHVGPQMTFMRKREITVGTFVRFHMGMQATCRGGCKATKATFERLLSCVCSHVILENMDPRGCILAKVALVKFFSSVCSHVYI